MTYDITPHITGDTWEGLGNFTLTKNGSAIDLTGASVELEVKSIFNLASPIILSLTTENSAILIVNPPTSGIIFTPETIVDIPVGNYSWSLTLKLQTEEIKTYMSGNWKIIPKTPYSFNWQEAPRII
jgi:hypothetical protein